jgi:peroxiredoxin
LAFAAMSSRVLPRLIVGLGLMFVSLAFAVALLRQPSSTSGATAGNGSEIQVPCTRPGQVSFPAPPLSLVDLHSQPVSLAGMAGSTVLVNTWATWCPPCRQEMPDLEAYYLAHRGQNFHLVAINIGETPQAVEAFANRSGLSFDVWLDPEQQALEAFHTVALPSSFVIDAEGTVRLAWSGATCRQALEDTVTPLLGP